MVPELNVSVREDDRTRVKYEYHGHEGRKISYTRENVRKNHFRKKDYLAEIYIYR